MTEDEKLAERRKPAEGRRGGTGGGESGNVGDALRAVYHDAVSENVPDEMLDLLSKLR